MQRALAWLVVGSLLVAGGAGTTAGQTNLIVNGGGESDVGSSDGYVPAAISTWQQSGEPNVVAYTAEGGFPTAADPGPDVRGANFFAGGYSAAVDATLFQTIDVSAAAAEIDAGTMPFTLCGFLGGYAGQDDNATVLAQFLDGSAGEIGSASIGPVLAADRGSQTSLCLRTTSGVVPGGTRTVAITVLFDESAGPYNDGYADNLNFLLSASCPETGSTCTPTSTSTSTVASTSSTSTTILPTTSTSTSSSSSTSPPSTAVPTTTVPAASTTTTSSLVPGTTTSTTIASACVPAVTLASIRCRLEALVEDVTAATDLGILQPKLVSLASDALARAIEAETAASARPRRNLLKAVARKLMSFSHRVRSRKGRKTIPEATRDRLTGEADPIRTDVVALRRTI
jgi:hypothetical protein